MIEIILLFISLAVLAGIYYYKTREKDGKYIWLGKGEDPFKE